MTDLQTHTGRTSALVLKPGNSMLGLSSVVWKFKSTHHHKHMGCDDREWHLGQWLLSMVRLMGQLVGMLNCRHIHIKGQCVPTPTDVSEGDTVKDSVPH